MTSESLNINEEIYIIFPYKFDHLPNPRSPISFRNIKCKNPSLKERSFFQWTWVDFESWGSVHIILSKAKLNVKTKGKVTELRNSRTLDPIIQWISWMEAVLRSRDLFSAQNQNIYLKKERNIIISKMATIFVIILGRHYFLKNRFLYCMSLKIHLFVPVIRNPLPLSLINMWTMEHINLQAGRTCKS